METLTQMQALVIPLSQIHSNPENPRPLITDEMVAQLSANIQEVGLLNPIKVMADPQSPGSYINLCGEIRYRAFQKLGREAIPAYVLNPNPEEAFLTAYLDNRKQDMGWWADYRSVEGLLKANPKLTQRQVAAKLELDLEKVNRSLRLLPLLNPDSRDLIVRNTNNSKPAKRPISEIAISRLAALGPDKSLKPGVKKKGASVDSETIWPFTTVPSETQDLVKSCLEVVIERHLTESGVKKLVAWVQAGQKPQDFGRKVEEGGNGTGDKADPDPTAETLVEGDDPLLAYWKPLPPTVQVHKTPNGYRVVMDWDELLAPAAVYGAMAWTESLRADIGIGTPDLQYNNAWPHLLEEAKRQSAVGSSQSAAEEKANAEAKAQPATEAKQATAGKDQATTEAGGDKAPIAKPGVVDQVKQAVKENLNLTPGGIADGLVRDAKQAVNYEIRKGLRDILKDVF